MEPTTTIDADGTITISVPEETRRSLRRLLGRMASQAGEALGVTGADRAAVIMAFQGRGLTARQAECACLCVIGRAFMAGADRQSDCDPDWWRKEVEDAVAFYAKW